MKTKAPPRGGWRRNLVVFSMRLSRKLVNRGWTDSAVSILERVAEVVPELLAIRIWLARIAISTGDDILAARAIIPEVVDRTSNVRFHSRRIASIYLALEDVAAAERYLALASDYNPDSPELWRMHGMLQRLRGNVDEAVKSFQHVAMLECTTEKKVKAIKDAATTLADAGRKDAEEFHKQILEIDPDDVVALFGIVDCRRDLELTDPIVNSIRRLIQDSSLSASQASHLHYALGSLYSNCGSPGASMAHLMIANRLRASVSPPFDLMKKKAGAEARIKVFTAELINELSQYGYQEDLLICVVGMPRSGTTLVEQILGSHSEARALGERNDFWKLARNLPKLLNSKSAYPDCCRGLTGKQINQISQMILNRLRRTAGACRRVITKLPEDYFEIGMIKILFPKARIINCRRNPLDAGLSCFMQNFRHIPYARDLDSLAEVFKIYRMMIQRWKEALPPGSILDVDYEQIVKEPERIVQQMCDYVGLPFEKSCLQFHTRNQPIKTMSRWQVRQPIYQTSVNRSETYREFLGPLLSLVQDSQD